MNNDNKNEITDEVWVCLVDDKQSVATRLGLDDAAIIVDYKEFLHMIYDGQTFQKLTFLTLDEERMGSVRAAVHSTIQRMRMGKWRARLRILIDAGAKGDERFTDPQFYWHGIDGCPQLWVFRSFAVAQEIMPEFNTYPCVLSTSWQDVADGTFEFPEGAMMVFFVEKDDRHILPVAHRMAADYDVRFAVMDDDRISFCPLDEGICAITDEYQASHPQLQAAASLDGFDCTTDALGSQVIEQVQELADLPENPASLMALTVISGLVASMHEQLITPVSQTAELA